MRREEPNTRNSLEPSNMDVSSLIKDEHFISVNEEEMLDEMNLAD